MTYDCERRAVSGDAGATLARTGVLRDSGSTQTARDAGSKHARGRGREGAAHLSPRQRDAHPCEGGGRVVPAAVIDE